MNLCQHNQEINLFCLTESCIWKEASGCEKCMKKYHKHFGKVRVISKNQLNQSLRKFQLQKSTKPHSKALQDSIFGYLREIRNQFVSCLDSFRKTAVQQLAFPFLSQSAHFKTFKKLKNEEFRKMNRREIASFCSFANTIQSSDLHLQQQKIYHELSEKILETVSEINVSFQKLSRSFDQQKITLKTFEESFRKITEINNARKICLVSEPINKKNFEEILNKKQSACFHVKSSRVEPTDKTNNFCLENYRQSPRKEYEKQRPRELSIDRKIRNFSRKNSYDDKQKEINEKKLKLFSILCGNNEPEPPKLTAHPKSLRIGNHTEDMTNSLPEKKINPKAYFVVPKLKHMDSLEAKFDLNEHSQQQSHENLFGRFKTIGIDIPEIIIQNKMLPEAQEKSQKYENSPDIIKRTIKVPLQTVNQEVEPRSPLLKKRQAQSKQNTQFLINPISAEEDRIKEGASEKQPQEQIIQDNEAKSLELLMRAVHLAPSKAIPLLENAIKVADNNFSAAEYLSYLYLQVQPKKCLHLCNTFLDKIQFSTQYDQLSGHIINNKAAALNILGRYSESIEILEKRVIISKSDTVFKNLADSYFGIGIYEKSIINYEEAIKLNPKFDEALYNLAVCLFIQQNFNNSLSVLQKAIRISQRNQAYLSLMKVLEEKIQFSNVLVSNFEKPEA